jgi:hypothetical protein
MVLGHPTLDHNTTKEAVIAGDTTLLRGHENSILTVRAKQEVRDSCDELS